MGGENVDALKTRTEDKKNISKGREKKTRKCLQPLLKLESFKILRGRQIPLHGVVEFLPPWSKKLCSFWTFTFA